MSDQAVREALAKAHAPVTVEFSERWHLNLIEDALAAEIKKAEGVAKRAKHTGTKRQAEARIEGLRAAHAATTNARKES